MAQLQLAYDPYSAFPGPFPCSKCILNVVETRRGPRKVGAPRFSLPVRKPAAATRANTFG